MHHSRSIYEKYHYYSRLLNSRFDLIYIIYKPHEIGLQYRKMIVLVFKQHYIYEIARLIQYLTAYIIVLCEFSVYYRSIFEKQSKRVYTYCGFYMYCLVYFEFFVLLLLLTTDLVKLNFLYNSMHFRPF